MKTYEEEGLHTLAEKKKFDPLSVGPVPLTPWSLFKFAVCIHRAIYFARRMDDSTRPDGFCRATPTCVMNRHDDICRG